MKAMSTVRHWKRGYQHDHTGNSITGALTECFRCQGIDLSASATRMAAVLLEQRGNFEYVARDEDALTFKVVR